MARTRKKRGECTSNTAEPTSKTTKRPRRNANKSKRAHVAVATRSTSKPNASMPQAVLPLVWSFLLEPSSTYDPSSDEKGCLDFKSMASFMLVSKGSKQAFDECNGWFQCFRALMQEANGKTGVIMSFQRRMMVLHNKASRLGDGEPWEEEMIQHCRSLSATLDSFHPLPVRVAHMTNEIFPSVSLTLVGIGCGPSALQYTKTLKSYNGTISEFLAIAAEWFELSLANQERLRDIEGDD